MNIQKLTIKKASVLLRKNTAEDLGLDIRIAETHHAPGGGEMITYNSHLTPSALQFIARRKRSLDAEVTLLVYNKEDEPSLKEFRENAPLPQEIETEQKDAKQRAQKISQRVTRTANRVNRHAKQVHSALSSTQLNTQDFTRPEVKQALSVFGTALRRFRKNTEAAIADYIENGNTLIMDLITQYDMDVVSIKHALKVACFATELVSMMGEDTYFGETEPKEIYALLDETPPEHINQKELKEKKHILFKRELVEIFLGGFMHDAGLWQIGLQDGHEIRGAMVVAHTPQIETISQSLIDIVLFHSDVSELAENQGVLRVFGFSKDGGIVAFQKEYFKHKKDIQISDNFKKDTFTYKVFTETDLRKILPVAISENFITRTQARKPTTRHDAITELASHCEGGEYQKFMVAMCNTQTDVIAPTRSMVALEGSISVHRGDQPRWLDVTSTQAISVGHDDSRHSPHFITIFSREEDGSQKILEFLAPTDQRLWDRTDAESRMYVPGGRFRSLSYKVVAILRQDIYEKHFKAYETEVQQRVQAALIF